MRRFSARRPVFRAATGHTVVKVGVGAGMILLIAIAALGLFQLHELMAAGRLADHTRQVVSRVQMMAADLAKERAAATEFLLTRDDRLLPPDGVAMAGWPDRLDELRRLVAGDPDQQDRVDRLAALLTSFHGALSDLVQIEAAGPPAPAAIAMVAATFDTIEGEIQSLVDAENQRHELRQDRLARYVFVTAAAIAAATVVSLLLLATAVYATLGEARRRARAEARIKQTNRDLEQAVAARTRDLELQVAERDTVSATLAAVVDQAPFAVVGLAPDNTIMIWNKAAAALFGLAEADVLGRPDPVLHLEPVTGTGAEFGLGLKDGLRDLHLRRPGPDGKPRELVVSAAASRSRSGTVRAVVVIVEDITDRSAMEQQLRQAQKMEAVGQLTGGLAHDFNNLLTVIIGNLDLMESELAGTPSAELAQSALTAALRGAELTRQLLAFSRKQPLRTSVFNINDLVQGMVALMRRTLGERVHIDLVTDPELWPTRTDPAQVETAIANLTINARDAMPGGGRLTVETKNVHLDERYCAQNPGVTPGDYAMLAVSDTGTGIPPEHLEKVFEPFFTTKPVGKGSGLGLSMIYGFARQAGGHVKIYSEFGHGTTVRFYLPRVQTGEAGAQASSEPEVPRAAASEIILVVEDQPKVRETVMRQLGELGYQVLQAENAEAALDIVKTGVPIDLLFTDIVMPGGTTGIDLIHRVHALRPELKVLLTSGFTQSLLKNDNMPQVRAELLSKPYRMHDLAQAIRQALGRTAEAQS